MSGFVLITIPLLIVVLLVCIDILRRSDLGSARRIGWLVASLLFWPTALGYLVVRPVAERRPMTAHPGDDDPRRHLVARALAPECSTPGQETIE